MRRNRPWWLILFAVFFISGCVGIKPGQAGSGGKIRVLVLKGVSSVTIKGARNAGTLRVTKAAGNRVVADGREMELPLRFAPANRYVYINGHPYSGTVEIYPGKEGLLVIDDIFLESYLVGIINNEISTTWPANAVKAQAVVARTYALCQKKKRPGEIYHIEGSVMGQVYSGADTEDALALRAVRETAGEVLVYNGEPALTVYHSNAGGMTDSSKDVWLIDYPYLKSVKSPYDATYRQINWDFLLSKESIKKLLNSAGYSIGDVESITVNSITEAGRVKTVVIRDNEGRKIILTGEDLRKIVGYTALKSTIFSVEKSADLFAFKGRGAGHGVGLSQWGAKGMAENGYSYREILRHFYPGTSLIRAY